MGSRKLFCEMPSLAYSISVKITEDKGPFGRSKGCFASHHQKTGNVCIGILFGVNPKCRCICSNRWVEVLKFRRRV